MCWMDGWMDGWMEDELIGGHGHGAAQVCPSLRLLA